jgi:Flp pilus assembly protein TadG
MTRAMRCRLAGDEAGSVSIFVIGMVVVLLALTGLVVDGGRAINARATVTDDAEQAARAGANEIDEGTLRASGEVVIDEGAARSAIASFVGARNYPAGSTRIAFDDREVQVTIENDVDTALLALINIDSFHVSGTATARAAIGIDAEIGGAP